MRVEFSLSRRSQMDSNTKKRENHNEKIRPHYLNAIHSSPDKFSSFLLENKLQSKFVVGFGRQDIFDKGTGFFFLFLIIHPTRRIFQLNLPLRGTSGLKSISNSSEKKKDYTNIREVTHLQISFLNSSSDWIEVGMYASRENNNQKL